MISNFSPNEILVSKPSKNELKELIGNSYNVYPLDDWVFDSSYSKNKLLNHFKTKSLKGFGVDDIKLGIIAAGSVIHYLDDTEHNNLSHISNLQRIFPDSYVWMDKFTMKNLELFNSNSSNGFNLSETIDDSITSMGSRKLKNWIAFPLVEKKEIKKRQDIVYSIIEDNEISGILGLCLSYHSCLDGFPIEDILSCPSLSGLTLGVFQANIASLILFKNTSMFSSVMFRDLPSEIPEIKDLISSASVLMCF